MTVTLQSHNMDGFGNQKLLGRFVCSLSRIIGLTLDATNGKFYTRREAARKNKKNVYLLLAFEPVMFCCPCPGIHRNRDGSLTHTRFLWAGWRGQCYVQRGNWYLGGARCPHWVGRTDGILGRTGTDGQPWKVKLMNIRKKRWRREEIYTFQHPHSEPNKMLLSGIKTKLHERNTHSPRHSDGGRC